MSWENDDPRVMPGEVFIPEGMHDPDWGRYKVAGQKLAPVGDPTRWGAQVNTTIPLTGIQDSAQVLAMGTRDPYARSWSILGTIGLPASMWNLAESATVTLDIAMGVGQAQITHRIVLLDVAAALLGPPASGGIAYDQYILQGGPYNQIPALPVLIRAFAIVGGIVGQSVNIRVNYTIPAASPSLPFVSPLVLIASPFAAGQDL